MARVKQQYEANGFYGIGIMHSYHQDNIGTLWRSAFIMGASFIFTVDKKYKPQCSDVTKAWTKIPLYHYPTLKDLQNNIPYSAPLVGVELTDEAIELDSFEHPPRAIYLLGNEQCGLPPAALDICHSIVKLPGHFSLNVATAGSILMYDRISKVQTKLPARA